MAIYYYEDQNGKYSSHTDARRFSRVSGKRKDKAIHEIQ